ncbi:MAG: FecR domain-containing protein [Bacteroidota bacterium]
MKIDIDYLFHKYRKGECSPDELKILRAYFQQDDLSQLDEQLRTEWERLSQNTTSVDTEAKEEVWLRLEKRFYGEKSKVVDLSNKRRRRYALAAAVVLMLISAGLYLYWPISDNTYVVERKNNDSAPLFMALEDGTEVWLKPNSQLSYPKRFSENSRSVQLAGEAFFNVKKDKTRPFTVTSGEIRTKVLGTSFNVRAFPERADIEVALLEGKVLVGITENEIERTLATLSPGEAFTFSKSSGEFSKKQFVGKASYQWQGGVIHFQKAHIQEVVETLEDWYGVSIRIAEEAKITETLVHRIDTHKLNIDEVLDGINLVANDYEFKKIKDKAYIVAPKD